MSDTPKPIKSVGYVYIDRGMLAGAIERGAARVGDALYVIPDSRVAQLERDLHVAKEQAKADAAYIANLTEWRSQDRKDLAAAKAEVEGCETTIIRQGDILRGVANALKGEPKPGTSHSHHDLAEVAAALRDSIPAEVSKAIEKERDAWTTAVAVLPMAQVQLVINEFLKMGNQKETALEWLRRNRPQPIDVTCWCHACRPDLSGYTMILCPTCGNKRCPHANHHSYACTGSNETGQPWSAYP